MKQVKQGKQMMRVVYFGHQTEVAGGEISLMQLIDSLDKTAVLPEVVVPGQGRFSEELNKRSSLIKHELPLPQAFVKSTAAGVENGGFAGKLWNGLHIVKAAWQLRRQLRRIKPDILHTNTLKAALIATLATWNTHIQHVYHDRTFTYNAANRLVYRRAARVIAISDYVRDKYSDFDKRKIRRVYNGVKALKSSSPASLREQYALQPEDVLIGIVGRLTPWKGHRCFIEAAIRLLQTTSASYRFLIIGTDDIEASAGYGQELQAMIRASGHAERFVFTGFREDVQDVMSQLDVLVVPSIEPEPFGRVIIEGQMAGTVLVASRIGGIPELIRDRETGLLFEPGDAAQLAACIRLLTERPDVRTSIRAAGYLSATTSFTIEQHAGHIQHLYEELLYGS